LAADVVYAAVLSMLAFRILGMSGWDTGQRLAQLFLPFAICLPLATYLSDLLPAAGVLSTDIMKWLGAELAYLAVGVPACAGLGLQSDIFRRYLGRQNKSTI